MSDSPEEVEKPGVRDHRGKNWFWADNEIIDLYGPLVGAYGIAVYAYLARRVDAEQKCWPSYEAMAKTLKISRPTAIAATKDLEACGLIKTESRNYQGSQQSNYFYLMPRESWVPPTAVSLPSEAIKQRKKENWSAAAEASKQGLPQGKQNLPGGKQHSPPSKQPSKQRLPEEEGNNKQLQNPGNNTQQQHAAAVSAEAIAQELIALGITPASVAARLAAASPELARAWLEFVKANPKLGPGFLRKRIEGGEFPPGQREAATAYQVPGELAAAGAAVWAKLTKAQKDTFKNDFQQEWWNKYRDEAFSMDNPLHHEAWLQELVDPRTLAWLQGEK